MPEPFDVEDQSSNNDDKAPEAETPSPVSDDTPPAETEPVVEVEGDDGKNGDEVAQSDAEQVGSEEPELSKEAPTSDEEPEPQAEETGNLEESQPMSMQVADSGIGLDPQVEGEKSRPASPAGSASHDLGDDATSGAPQDSDARPDETNEEVVADSKPLETEATDETNADLNASQPDQLSQSDEKDEEPASSEHEPEPVSDNGAAPNAVDSAVDTAESDLTTTQEPEAKSVQDGVDSEPLPAETTPIPAEPVATPEVAHDEVIDAEPEQLDEEPLDDHDNLDSSSEPVVKDSEPATAETSSVTQDGDSVETEIIETDQPASISGDQSEVSLDQPDVPVEEERSLTNSRPTTPVQPTEAEEAATNSETATPEVAESSDAVPSEPVEGGQETDVSEPNKEVTGDAEQGLAPEPVSSDVDVVEAESKGELQPDGDDEITPQAEMVEGAIDSNDQELAQSPKAEQQTSGPGEDRSTTPNEQSDEVNADVSSANPNDQSDDVNADVSLREAPEESLPTSNGTDERSTSSADVVVEQPSELEPPQSQAAEQEVEEPTETVPEATDSSPHQDERTESKVDDVVIASVDTPGVDNEIIPAIENQDDKYDVSASSAQNDEAEIADSPVSSNLPAAQRDHEASIVEEHDISTSESVTGEAGSHILSTDSDADSKIADEDNQDDERHKIGAGSDLTEEVEDDAPPNPATPTAIQLDSIIEDPDIAERKSFEDSIVSESESSSRGIADRSADILEPDHAVPETQVGTTPEFPLNMEFPPDLTCSQTTTSPRNQPGSPRGVRLQMRSNSRREKAKNSDRNTMRKGIRIQLKGTTR